LDVVDRLHACFGLPPWYTSNRLPVDFKILWSLCATAGLFRQ
jgi:hypothetical protein